MDEKRRKTAWSQPNDGQQQGKEMGICQSSGRGIPLRQWAVGAAACPGEIPIHSNPRGVHALIWPAGRFDRVNACEWAKPGRTASAERPALCNGIINHAAQAHPLRKNRTQEQTAHCTTFALRFTHMLWPVPTLSVTAKDSLNESVGVSGVDS
uniref:Uncharacterized protein n=1 Tax=Anopheles coluzzii TaxID=1518534 RepID=A0A8W7Q1V2_ANOCL